MLSKYQPTKKAGGGRKAELVSDIESLLSEYPAAILTDYRGLTVSELTELRRRLREVNAEYHVVKNTLFRRAQATPQPDLDTHLNGPTAVAFGKDPVAPAKVLLDYVRERRKPEPSIKAGLIDGRVFDAAGVEAISKLPGRDQLIAQIVGQVQAPIYGLVGTLNGIISNFVYTLQAVADQKGSGS